MLDYSKDPGTLPTLRQMIMELKCPNSSFPLFHCVDLDWRKEGFVFQHSPDLDNVVETTITTLLPLLRHLHPTVDVPSSFNEDAAYKTQSMEWCDTKQNIVDTLSPDDTAHIPKEDNLVGFVFDLGSIQKQEQPKPKGNEKISNFQLHDDDCISTLKSLDGTIRSTITRPIIPTTTIQPTSDATILSHSSMTSTQK